MDDERFDGLYLNVANTTQGIEPLLDTVFSFLRRKTDFFSGPPGSGEKGTEVAVQKVNEVLRKHVDLYLKQKKYSESKKQADAKPKKAVEKDTSVVEMGTDGAFDLSEVKSKPPEPHASGSPSGRAEVETKQSAKPEKDEAEEESGEEIPPVGNGGTVEGKYVWTQTLSEVNVNVPVPDNTRGRDVTVTIAKKHLKVGLRSQPGKWIVDAPLVKSIVCDDSFWTIEDGNRLVINLQKLNQMEWWNAVCEGDPTIDVTKVQPENSSLNDLDGETRKTVEKMMYDQRQKARGLPSSDEEQKLAALEKFKLQHPELDFSNAKIN